MKGRKKWLIVVSLLAGLAGTAATGLLGKRAMDAAAPLAAVAAALLPVESSNSLLNMSVPPP